jgi:hypothetical protein
MTKAAVLRQHCPKKPLSIVDISVKSLFPSYGIIITGFSYIKVTSKSFLLQKAVHSGEKHSRAKKTPQNSAQKSCGNLFRSLFHIN